MITTEDILLFKVNMTKEVGTRVFISISFETIENEICASDNLQAARKKRELRDFEQSLLIYILSDTDE